MDECRAGWVDGWIHRWEDEDEDENEDEEEEKGKRGRGRFYGFRVRSFVFRGPLTT